MKLPPPGLAAPPGFQNSSAAQHLPPNNLGEQTAPVFYNPCQENMLIDLIVLHGVPEKITPSQVAPGKKV